MQYLFDIYCLIVCLKMDFVYRMKHVREGERRSRRKLGLGQGMVGEAHCISLVEVAAEQMLEPIDIFPVVPVAPALQRGWGWWCVGAALNVGNMIVI